jgi:hypothetical protein
MATGGTMSADVLLGKIISGTAAVCRSTNVELCFVSASCAGSL